MTQSKQSPVRRARQKKILDAATHLFNQYGFRGVTMEGIAKEAGVAKATMYAYFSDKEQTFSSVAQRAADNMQKAFTQALESEGTVAERINAALIAKHRVTSNLVRQSPHAKELFATKNRLVGDMFQSLDRSIEEDLSTLLSRSTNAGKNAERVARLLFSASLGIANRESDFDVTSANIKELVISVLAGYE